jgi:uncharacterized protein
VAKKALSAAARVADLNPDLEFIEEASMLHDIGIFLTDSPEIGCHGASPYIMHGVLGRKLLEDHGLLRHALVCERHVGVGLTVEDILSQGLPLPLRDMTPRSLEEELICYADKFYSKSPQSARERSAEEIVDRLARFGDRHATVFRNWLRRFDPLPT